MDFSSLNLYFLPVTKREEFEDFFHSEGLQIYLLSTYQHVDQILSSPIRITAVGQSEASFYRDFTEDIELKLAKLQDQV